MVLMELILSCSGTNDKKLVPRPAKECLREMEAEMGYSNLEEGMSEKKRGPIIFLIRQ